MVGRYGFFVSIIGAVLGLSLLAWRLSAVQDAREASGVLASPGQIADGEGFGYADALDQARLAATSAKLAQAMTAAQALRAYEGDQAVTTEALRRYDPTLDPTVAVAFTATGLCVQAGANTDVVHVTELEPGPKPGPCV